MYYSLFEIFSVGIGPSSSHTVGPMKAAHRFVQNLKEQNLLNKTTRIETNLYGSLALTGIGHGTLKALAYGFEGLNPEEMDAHFDYVAEIKNSGKINLLGKHKIKFNFEKDIHLEKNICLKEHPNGMKFTAFNKENTPLLQETYFSVGGGTIARQDEIKQRIDRKPYNVPYQFNSCKESNNQLPLHTAI